MTVQQTMPACYIHIIRAAEGLAGRPRRMFLRSIESDLQPINVGLLSAGDEINTVMREDIL